MMIVKKYIFVKKQGMLEPCFVTPPVSGRRRISASMGRVERIEMMLHSRQQKVMRYGS